MGSLILGPIAGGLSADGVNLWGRADGPGTLHAWIGEQPDLSDARLGAASLPLDEENGFAGVAPVRELAPNTRYYYALTLDASPPAPRSKPFASFTTNPPDGERAPFTFAFGSCFRPENERGGQIFNAIEARRPGDDLRFILLIGDQIYADAYDHNDIGKVCCSLEEYRQVYAYTWSRPPFRRLLENLPAYMTLDDHEVDDDWTWTSPDREFAQIPFWDRVMRWIQGRSEEERRIPRQRVRDALQAYWEHQGMHAPHFQLPPKLNTRAQYALTAEDPGSLAYTFTFGAAAFFVLDTRTMRVKSREEKSMLGDGQWLALQSWLLTVKDRYPVKFIVSSCAMLFDMWIDLANDRWRGFDRERQRLLHFLAANGIEGVYILSGDLHSAHAVRVELYGPEQQGLPLWEFCSTPFEQDPNLLSRYTYYRLRTGPIKGQECLFVIDEKNFGVVEVDYPIGGKPGVIFKVYGESGELLSQAGA